MDPELMNLKILLPYQVFADLKGIKRIVTESLQGSFGLLPHRLDCTAALAPGILMYETEAGKEVSIAIDEGILVKAGYDVLISVRNAIEGTELGQLHVAVEKEFKNIDEQEKNVRSIMARLEMGFIRRFEELRKI
jgi:F-type H+-transporting ATPase subunit epsilon